MNDTLVLCFSDHGMPFPGAKGSPYETGLHLPLTAMGPGLPKGQVSDAFVSLTDITPTVLDWCGAKAPDGYQFHGKSFVPELNGASSGDRDEHYYSHTFHEIVNFFPWRGVRTRQYKYTKFLFPELEMPLPSDLWSSPTWNGVRVRKLPTSGARPVSGMMRHAPEELFDMEADPMETKNLAGSAEHQAILAELRGKVRKFRQETRDVWLGYFDRIERAPEPLTR